MIYFIRQEGSPFVKIGYTDASVMSRLASLQTGNPSKLSVYATFPGGLEDEARLHDIFGQYRVRGEWFFLSRDIRTYVKKTQEGIPPEKMLVADISDRLSCFVHGDEGYGNLRVL